jgi:hypothetical protein
VIFKLHGRTSSVALVEAASYGLRNLPKVRLERLPRMADFALWSTACETAFWPAGTFVRAYDANRRAALEDVIEADPVATRLRELMAERTAWTGNASDLLRIGADAPRESMSWRADGWPKSPRALAGRLPVARRRRFGRSALKLPSAEKGERDTHHWTARNTRDIT